MARVVCLCVDGYANKMNIRKAVEDAYENSDITLDSGQMSYSKSKYMQVCQYHPKVLNLIIKNGGNPSQLSLLLVGKSLGAVKLYRFAYQNASLLKSFARAAVVLVDAHEPVIPGDEGGTGKWYDFVYFYGGRYRLRWWSRKWGPHGNQSEAHAKMRFFVVYQRNEWPRGYNMASPFKRVSLTGKKVKPHGQSTKEIASHWNIARCDKTVSVIEEAIAYLQG